MAVQRITKRTVDAARPGPRNAFLWDRDVRGFGLKVTPAGRRVYIVQYRQPGLGRRGLTRRITLGEHGTITAEQARELARQVLANVAKGADPAAERTRRKNAPTVAELGKDFLEDVDARRKPRTAAEYRRLWTKHVVPALGSLMVEKVSVGDVRRLHRAIKAGRREGDPKDRRETPYLANRVLALCGSFFSYAESEGVRAKHTNPAHPVSAFPEQSRERFLTPDEVSRLGDVLRRSEREGLPPAPKRRSNRATAATRKHVSEYVVTPANPFAVAVVRFLLLTGCRESEALTLRWDAVDLTRGFLRLTETKTGKSTRPLSAPAAELLAALPRLEGSPYVFPGRQEREPLKDIARFWDAVRHAAGLDDVRLHDLRHSFASTSALGGDSLLVTGKLLGHRHARTTSKYAHLGDDPVKAAADRTGGTLAAWLEGKDTAAVSIDAVRAKKQKRHA